MSSRAPGAGQRYSDRRIRGGIPEVMTCASRTESDSLLSISEVGWEMLWALGQQSQCDARHARHKPHCSSIPHGRTQRMIVFHANHTFQKHEPIAPNTSFIAKSPHRARRRIKSGRASNQDLCVADVALDATVSESEESCSVSAKSSSVSASSS